jgi:hypothetical protein
VRLTCYLRLRVRRCGTRADRKVIEQTDPPFRFNEAGGVHNPDTFPRQGNNRSRGLAFGKTDILVSIATNDRGRHELGFDNATDQRRDRETDTGTTCARRNRFETRKQENETHAEDFGGWQETDRRSSTGEMGEDPGSERLMLIKRTVPRPCLIDGVKQKDRHLGEERDGRGCPRCHRKGRSFPVRWATVRLR